MKKTKPNAPKSNMMAYCKKCGQRRLQYKRGTIANYVEGKIVNIEHMLWCPVCSTSNECKYAKGKEIK